MRIPLLLLMKKIIASALFSLLVLLFIESTAFGQDSISSRARFNVWAGGGIVLQYYRQGYTTGEFGYFIYTNSFLPGTDYRFRP